jgi:UDP-N-acetyl-D-galactosamine dehydrogenase
MRSRGIDLQGARVLVLGYTFKENCADTRNTRVADIVEELTDYSVQVDVHEPWVPADVMQSRHGVEPVIFPERGAYDAIIVAVGHKEFVEMGSDAVRALGKPNAVLFDIKGIYGKTGSDMRL